MLGEPGCGYRAPARPQKPRSALGGRAAGQPLPRQCPSRHPPSVFHAPEIAENECWENQEPGILLMRDPNSPDAPSEAALRGNRCHGNAGAGIILLSSHAAEIAENECWENQAAGIALQRDPKSPEAPSEAALRGNRCHGNALVGITIEGSNAAEIAANELWGNVQRGLRVAGKQGTSRIGSLHGNRIFNERNAVVVLHGTELPPTLRIIMSGPRPRLLHGSFRLMKAIRHRSLCQSCSRTSPRRSHRRRKY